MFCLSVSRSLDCNILTTFLNFAATTQNGAHLKHVARMSEATSRNSAEATNDHDSRMSLRSRGYICRISSGVRRRSMIAEPRRFGFAGKATMGVGEMVVSRQIDPVEPRVRPNDPVVGAALSRIVLGPEDDEVLLGVRHTCSQSTRREEAEKQYRSHEPHHGLALRNGCAEIAASAGTKARAASDFRGLRRRLGHRTRNRRYDLRYLLNHSSVRCQASLAAASS
jgi:hypothetical protein